MIPNHFSSLHNFLDAKADQYNRPSFIERDPISIPHRFSQKQDIEKCKILLGHKGRWIGIGGLIMAAGSAICALPHWIIDPYQPTDLTVDPNEDFGQCYANRFVSCGKKDTN